MCVKIFITVIHIELCIFNIYIYILGYDSLDSELLQVCVQSSDFY